MPRSQVTCTEHFDDFVKLGHVVLPRDAMLARYMLSSCVGKTIHILQLFFIALSVTDVICDFGCFISLSFPCIVHFHFIIVLIFSTEI